MITGIYKWLHRPFLSDCKTDSETQRDCAGSNLANVRQDIPLIAHNQIQFGVESRIGRPASRRRVHVRQGFGGAAAPY